MKISTILILRNAIINGYPFIEAIKQIFPVSDEILISDGYSTDGTFEILKKISKKHKKVKLFRDKWPKKRGKFDIIKDKILKTGVSFIGELSNRLKNKAKGDFIIYLQADEIWHDNLVKNLKNVLSDNDDADILYFPFIDVIGKYQQSFPSWKARVLRNDDKIKIYADAAQITYSYPVILSMFFNIKKIRNLLMFFSDSKRKYIPTCYPIFHFHAIYYKNYLNKIKTHQEYMQIQTFTNKRKLYFIKKFMRTKDFKYIVKLTGNKFKKIDTTEIPKIMKNEIEKDEYIPNLNKIM